MRETFFELSAITLDPDGRVTLSDGELRELEQTLIDTVIAGGNNTGCPVVNNPQCTNGSCGGTQNDHCTNTGTCDGSTNYWCQNTGPGGRNEN
ncbi:MAG: hypothetical protein JWP35_2742 [Caulobacter sp.]|nr:hypothetical protein [Caulobacter sp.]